MPFVNISFIISYDSDDELTARLDELEQLGYNPDVEYEEDEN